jgi:pimeloyl-ACP methyl ester carboxylesterase
MQPHESGLPAQRLVAVGSADRFVPPANSLRIAARLGVAPVILEGRAHDLPIDDPDATAALLARFVGADPGVLSP